MEVDERLRFLETRITSSLRPRNDDLKALFAGDQNRHAFLEFCNNEDVRRLFVYTTEPKSTLVSSLIPPSVVRSKALFFLKTNQASKLTKDNIRTDVVFTDCDTTTLMQLDLLVREVYLPLLCTDGVQTYSGVSADKLMDVLHRMTGNVEVTSGNVEGQIILPLPSIEVLAEAATLQQRRSAVIHVLESSVIGWIKQIKLLLKHDPLLDLRQIYGTRPTPLDEVNMWKKRQQLLFSVNNQLDSTVASDILLNLDEANSTYSYSFHNVRKEISQSYAETNENLCFLGTLLPWFEKLHQACFPEEMLRVFPPLIHTMLLVWSHSRYYHQSDKFHNLLELVSNEVVIRAQNLVGENILHNTVQSYAGLKDALRVSAAYRGTYLDMKDTADDINTEKVSETAEAMNLNPPKGVLYTSKLYSTSTKRKPRSAGAWRGTTLADVGVMKEEEWTDSPWPRRNAPCFNRMNSFMERCNDLLELVQTTCHFSLLEMAAEVGGAGTKSLDALVREIHMEFTCAMEDFGKHVADILDITATQAFEKAFFTFRSIVKDLERRLAVVLRQSFQQCPTIGSQLRLLEVFEGVSGREMVQEYLKDKDHQLINLFTNELIAVRSMFLAKMKDSPLHKNLPPIVSRLTWVGALKRRIKEPMEKLKRISPHSLDGDAGWHLRDIFADTMKDFDKYEERTVREWQNQLHAELRDRLKQPLLTAEEYDEEVELRPQALSVNLDPELLLLLREVHYLSQPPFNIKLPKNVRDLLRHTDATILRMTAARLETIVSKYNSAMRSMVDFEKPLFERNMAKIDQLLDQGLNHYTWKTSQSADFIELASSLVGSELHRTLAVVQSNCQEMVDIAQSWSGGALDVFASRAVDKSYQMDKLIAWQSELNAEHERLIKPSGLKIHSLLHNSFEAVQISRASPAWEEYVDHIDALVLDGLKTSTLKSLRYMLNTLVHSNVLEVGVKKYKTKIE